MTTYQEVLAHYGNEELAIKYMLLCMPEFRGGVEL